YFQFDKEAMQNRKSSCEHRGPLRIQPRKRQHLTMLRGDHFIRQPPQPIDSHCVILVESHAIQNTFYRTDRARGADRLIPVAGPKSTDQTLHGVTRRQQRFFISSTVKLSLAE